MSQYVLLPLYSFIRLFVYSFDVIHTLGIYSWGIKIDVIPGRVNSAVTFRLLNKGEFLGIIMDDMIIIIIDYFSLVCLFFYLIPLNTLLWSLFKAIVLNDIKSIIALSTISQISYMFIALLINLILCFYHIMIHSLFKSILSLLAGCLIHIQHNYQNIYQIKMNYSIYWIIYLLTSSILI